MRKKKNSTKPREKSITQKSLSQKGRILELDFMRGLAVIGMIVFHYYFTLDFYEIQQHNVTEGGWHILGQFVRFTFLTLVGISIIFSRNNNKRAFIILLCAMAITLASYFFQPDLYVRFGILHLIAVSIFLIAPLKNYPHTALTLGIIAIIIPVFLLQFSSSSLALIILGVQPLGFSSFDLFPIFPWIAIPLFGIFLGNMLYKNKKPLLPNRLFQKHLLAPVCIFGKHALFVYMIHIPIIFTFLLIAGRI